MKKVAIVTGTSSGLGMETSVLLAQNGFTVYATVRDVSKTDELQNLAKEKSVDLNILRLDVTNQESIDECVNTVLEKEGQIDLLVNNAGAGFAKTTEQFSEEEMQWVMDVNFFGVVRCIKAVIPHMRKQGKGYVINVTSVGGLVGQPFNELYCGAKFAVEGYTESLATYLTDAFGIKFTLIEPGGMASKFLKSATEKTMTNGQMTLEPYQPLLYKYMAGFQERNEEGGSTHVSQTPLEVAEIILELTKKENPPLRMRTSDWGEEFTQLKTKADPDGTKIVDAVIQKFLK